MTADISELSDDCTHDCHLALHDEIHESLRILMEIRALLEQARPLVEAYRRGPASGSAALLRWKRATK